MSNPLVSVIIPAYNAEKFIIKALDSVFAQTYRPIEVIVVDDGSTDGTAEIVKNCRLNKAKDANQTKLIYIYQHNSGPSTARNTGIKAAKGKYIAFLDADDLWQKYKIKKQIELFKRDSRIDIVFANAKITRTINKKTEDFIIFHREQLNKEFFGHDYLVLDPLAKLLKINFIPTSSVLAKKTCFKDGICFNQKRRYVEDWELWLKMSIHFTFAYIDDVCVHKKEIGDGLSSNSDSMLLSRLEVMEEALRDNTTYVSSQLIRKTMSEYVKDSYKWAGYHFMLKGDNKLARHYYKKSLMEGLDLQTVFYYCRTIINS